jgi:hypothetical protein
MSCIYCNGVVHEKRIEILKSKGSSITCISCAESKVQRVTGFQVNNDKACREIQVCTPEQASRLMKLQRKGGGATGGPSMGRKAGEVVYRK